MLNIQNLSYKTGNFALKHLNLKIQDGSYAILLGPSGSGKSLLLDVLAGIRRQGKGNILLDKKNISHAPIHHRAIGVVFQEASLFPHMTVESNIAYAIKGKLRKSELKNKVRQTAQDMEIEQLLERYPKSLSGGEKQRVALARTLIRKPKILLLDEPLSSIDTQLKSQLRKLLKNIHKTGQTILHVTHDFEDAVSLAEDIAVMQNGEIIQRGSASEVFNEPANQFIADLTQTRNFFKVSIPESEKEMKEGIINERLRICFLSNKEKNEGRIIIPPDQIIVSEAAIDSSARNEFKGEIINVSKIALGYEIIVNIGIPLVVHITEESFNKLHLEKTKKIWLQFKASSVKFY